jgi:hypothetical protein
MARYILIDNCSGYIYFDSADVGGKIWTGDYTDNNGTLCHDDSPIGFARAADRHIGEFDRIYEIAGRYELQSNDGGYVVYRADINGGEAVPVTEDGQDAEQIAAVIRDCEYVTTIRCIDASET